MSQAVSWEGFAPVHAAATYGRVSVMHMLLTFGADAKAPAPNGVRAAVASKPLCTRCTHADGCTAP